jgi:hypothetical protein
LGVGAGWRLGAKRAGGCNGIVNLRPNLHPNLRPERRTQNKTSRGIQDTSSTCTHHPPPRRERLLCASPPTARTPRACSSSTRDRSHHALHSCTASPGMGCRIRLGTAGIRRALGPDKIDARSPIRACGCTPCRTRARTRETPSHGQPPCTPHTARLRHGTSNPGQTRCNISRIARRNGQDSTEAPSVCTSQSWDT